MRFSLCLLPLKNHVFKIYKNKNKITLVCNRKTRDKVTFHYIWNEFTLTYFRLNTCLQEPHPFKNS